MSKFRQATPADAAAIAESLVSLYRKLGGIYGIPYDYRSVMEAVLHTIRHGVCLTGPTACAGGFIDSYVWNRSVQIGNVLFWNYGRPSGVRILQALAAEFQRRGATHIMVASHFPYNRAAHLYRKFGLRQTETMHMVEIATMK